VTPPAPLLAEPTSDAVVVAGRRVCVLRQDHAGFDGSDDPAVTSVAGAGHLPLVDRPAEFVALVGDFLTGGDRR
jgi:hypothetical protein